MKKLIFIFLLVFVFISSNSFADNLTCQYKENLIEKERIEMLPFDNNGNQLADILIELPNEYDRPFKAKNINSLEISGYIDVFVRGVWSWNRRGDFAQYEKYNFTIPAYSTIEIWHPPVFLPHGVSGADSFNFVNEPDHNYSITYYNTDLVKIRPVNSITYTYICKNCGVNICKNDGEPCSFNSECGIGHCNIAGICDSDDRCPVGSFNYSNTSCINTKLFVLGMAVFGLFFLCIYSIKKDNEPWIRGFRTAGNITYRMLQLIPKLLGIILSIILGFTKSLWDFFSSISVPSIPERGYDGEPSYGGDDFEIQKKAFEDYKLTPLWRQRSLEFRKARGCCENCGITTNLQVHHMRYPPGNPEVNDDDWSNWKCLCQKCHAKVHGR